MRMFLRHMEAIVYINYFDKIYNIDCIIEQAPNQFSYNVIVTLDAMLFILCEMWVYKFFIDLRYK